MCYHSLSLFINLCFAGLITTSGIKVYGCWLLMWSLFAAKEKEEFVVKETRLTLCHEEGRVEGLSCP
jgi:hypothetical protein